MLASEFGVEPTPQTQQLYQEIKDWEQKTARIYSSKPQSGKIYSLPSTEARPPSALRKWVILTASLSLLILVGVISILLRPNRPAATQPT